MSWLVLALGCSADGGGSDGSGDTGPTGTADCAASRTDTLGPEPSFDRPDGEIRIQNDPGYAYLEGALADGPTPSLHAEGERSGLCRIVRYTPSTCEPACALPSVCVEGSCEPFPARLDAGPLELTGEGLDLQIPLDGTLAWFAPLPGPVTGALTARAQGGADLPAFEVGSCEVVPPRPAEDWGEVMAARAPGADAVLTWSPVDPSARVSLRMTTGIATHGGVAHAEIECEGPDTGSLTLPGRFLEELYSEGWGCGECGLNTLYRYRTGGAEVEGREVWFTTRAGIPFFHIPGRQF